MTLKMQNILNFNIFYNEVKSSKLPLKTAYKLSLLVKAIDDKIQFYQEKLQEILMDCAQLDENSHPIPTEDGSGVKIKPGFETECMNRVNELQSLEIELPDTKFNIDDFGNIEISVEMFSIILPFIEE